MIGRTQLGILVSVLLVGVGGRTAAQAIYGPAEVSSTENFLPPWNSYIPGITIFDVSLDANGSLASVDVLRDVPVLTTAAEATLQSWKFEPSRVGGNPQQSDLLVVFVLPPASAFPTYPSFSPLPRKSSSMSGYVLPRIVSVSYPQYPINSTISGSVVVLVAIAADGNATSWQTIRALDPCTRLALEAVKKWRFSPASLDGEPVASNVAIDFIFQPPRHRK